MPQTDFSIETLKAKLGGDFAKGHRYNVNIKSPAALTTFADIPDKLQYMCDSVSLPTKSLASTPHDIYGPPREMPYRETFTESALSFYLDDNLFIKRYFDDWQSLIIDSESGNPQYWDNYTTPLVITRLKNDVDKFDSPIGDYKIELREAYPSAVGEVALGHSQGNEVLKLSVTFKYRRWNTIANFN